MERFDLIRTRELTRDLFWTRDLTQGKYGIRVDSRELGLGHSIGLTEVGTQKLVVLSYNKERFGGGDTKPTNIIP